MRSKLKVMSGVNEIKAAVLRLTPAELDAFGTWFAEFDAAGLDRQMEDDVAVRGMSDRQKLYFMRGVLAVIGTALLALPWKDLRWSETIGGLLRAIGEAFVVALILEIVVDRAVKHRLVQETIQEVAPRILAHLLPDKIFLYIQERLLAARLVRTSWNITYRIELLPNPDYVKLETISIYEMANRAPEKSRYRAVYEVEVGSFANIGPTEITKVSVRDLQKPNGTNEIFHFPGCPAEQAPRKLGDYLAFDQVFDIPVHRGRPAMRFEFRSTEYFHVGSIVPFFSKYVVDLTVLRVIYPHTRLRAIVDFPANDTSELLPEQPAKGDDTYVFPNPILPGQGFTVRFPIC